MKAVAGPAFVLAFVLSCAPAAAAQDCAPYRTIIDAAVGEFAAIRGAPAGEELYRRPPFAGMFETSVRLPRMASCRIIYLEDMASYACTNVTAVESVMRSAYEASLADARACLSSWTPNDRNAGPPPPDSVTTISSTSLKGPGDLSYSLDLVVQPYNGRTFWRIAMLFALPRAAAAGA